ncbi:MAG: GIY-YIG nuclease family protein [Candidatus Brennerbacteria bacterium]
MRGCPPEAGKAKRAQADLVASGDRTTMVWVYVICGKNKFRYVGITKNLEERFRRHNHGRTPSTKPYKPFRLFYKEEFLDYKAARIREKFLKSGTGRNFLDNLKSV